ncbi:phosphatase PAP2 family protein [Candidatus Woesearchaeota archaeon]|nr:phosphatase PAP2 family protein [Candidatus Woesearchaeota archaeon]
MVYKFIKMQARDILADITAFGSISFYVLLLAVSLSLGEYELFTKMCLGLGLIFISVIIIKTFYFKERPLKKVHSNYFEKLDAASFPSVHASKASFLGILLSKYFGNHIFTALMIVLVLIIAYTRIYLKKHDFADVFAGVILGALSYFVVSLLLG